MEQQNDFYVLFRNNDKGQPYTKVHTSAPEIVSNPMYGTGKVFFPDHSFKNAKEGIAKVHITKEKDNFGFLDGEMVDMTKYLPSEEDIVNYIKEDNDFDILRVINTPNNGKMMITDGYGIVYMEDGKMKHISSNFLYGIYDPMYIDEMITNKDTVLYCYNDIIDKFSKPVTAEQVIEYHDTVAATIAGNLNTHVCYDGTNYYIGNSGYYYFYQDMYKLINIDGVVSRCGHSTRSHMDNVQRYVDFAITVTFGNGNADEIINLLNHIRPGQDESYNSLSPFEYWNESDMPKSLSNDSLIMEAYDMGIIDPFAFSMDATYIMVELNVSRAELVTKFTYDELKDIFTKINESNKATYNAITNLSRKGKISVDIVRRALRGWSRVI